MSVRLSRSSQGSGNPKSATTQELSNPSNQDLAAAIVGNVSRKYMSIVYSDLQGKHWVLAPRVAEAQVLAKKYLMAFFITSLDKPVLSSMST